MLLSKASKARRAGGGGKKKATDSSRLSGSQATCVLALSTRDAGIATSDGGLLHAGVGGLKQRRWIDRAQFDRDHTQGFGLSLIFWQFGGFVFAARRSLCSENIWHGVWPQG